MLPEQSEMNGPIVDAQAQLNPTSEVSAVAQSPPTFNGGRKARVGFSVIRGLTRNRRPLSSIGRPLVSLANSAWCTAHQRQGEKWSPSFSNGTQLCRFQSSDERNFGESKSLGFNQIQFSDHTTVRKSRASMGLADLPSSVMRSLSSLHSRRHASRRGVPLLFNGHRYWRRLIRPDCNDDRDRAPRGDARRHARIDLV